jgi:hypothetical protein
VRKTEGRPRHMWDDNIKIGWGLVDWLVLAQDRGQWSALVNMLTNIWVPQNVGKIVSS